MRRSEDLFDASIIEAKARTMFEEYSLALTGHRWDWTKASKEIQNKWRNEARRAIA